MNNQRQAGARNAKYKVICTENAETANCTFYNLIDDPLEEYPLAKPESCANYKNGIWTAAVPEWHFCRLQEVIGKESFLASPKKTNGLAHGHWQPSYYSVAALAD